MDPAIPVPSCAFSLELGFSFVCEHRKPGSGFYSHLKQVCTPGSPNRHIYSAFLAAPPSQGGGGDGVPYKPPVGTCSLIAAPLEQPQGHNTSHRLQQREW